MEAAGLALAITPLLAGCAKVIKTLYDVHKRYKAAPAMLTTIATECSTFRLALSRLQSLSKGEERDEILDSIGIAVLACEMTLSTLEENTMELSESVDGMGIDDSFQLGAIAKAKIVWKEEEMKDLLQQLQRHQNNLGFLLTVLQSDSTSQIHDLIVSQGTVLGAIFERAQTARNQSRNSSHSSERNSNRFSGVSICGSARSSILFDFDDEVVNARVYRKALSKWIRRNNDGTIPGQSAEVQDQRESSHPVLRENEGNARQSPARTESVQMGHLGEDTTRSGFIFPFSPNHDQPNVVSSTKGKEHEDTSRDTSGAYQTHQLPTLSEVEEPETGDRDEDLGHPQEPDRSRDETTESTEARQEVPRVSLAEPMITSRSTAAANKFPREYKLVVTGGSGVDKSGLATQLMWSHFADDYDPRIEDSYRKLCVIDDQVALLDVLDTAGQEGYSAMRDQYMRTGEGFMLVYSITSRQSFEEVFIIRQQILRIKNKDYFPIIIVGNKCDLEGEREVSKQEGESLARILGCQFIEASSQARINVDVAFYNLVREIRRYEKEMSAMESVLPTNRPGIEDMAISQPKSRRYFPSWLK